MSTNNSRVWDSSSASNSITFGKTIRKVLWLIAPTILGLAVLGLIYFLSMEKSIDHPPGVIVREYYPSQGWWVVEPETKGINPKLMEGANRWLHQNYPQVVSFTVVRDGYIVWERFFGGRTNQVINHQLYSATKSVLSTLVGIAIKQGYIESVNQTVAEFLPEYFDEHPQSEKSTITLGDLLTMRSGLAWSEQNPVGLNDSQEDFTTQILDLPKVEPRGTVFNYSSVDSHLISAILTKATGQSALSYASEKLYEPLGILNRQWSSDSNGINFGGTGIFLTSRNLAAIALLYLNNGYWEGEQIFAEDWVEQATFPHVVLRPGDNQEGLPEVNYGYHWWIRNQGGYQSYMAIGYAGQYIVVIPELDIAVVVTSVPLPNQPPSELFAASTVDFPLFEEYIIPAVIDK
ncbi:MAG: serine hydrolase [Anaerolineales bacterium]|jgi:CubicO group peptidase (beta-lactamase class C family)